MTPINFALQIFSFYGLSSHWRATGHQTRSLRRCLSVLLCSSLIIFAPLRCLADPAVPPPSMDLSSQQRTTPAALSGIIKVGNAVRVINANDLVTPAENAALYQTNANGNQSLVLGISGNAIGGLFNITPQIAGAGLDRVIIPSGVTAINSAEVLSVVNSFTNSGNFYVITNNPSQVAATIAAQSIYNQSNGVLSTVLPPTLGIASANPKLSLVLDAVDEFVNAGTVTSAGNLTLLAGNSILNQGVLSAATHINLSAPIITNSGSIMSETGNVNLASPSLELYVNNESGSIQALSGTINVRDSEFAGSATNRITGGVLSAQQINAYSGPGRLDLDVQQLIGTLNVVGKGINIRVREGGLGAGSIGALPTTEVQSPMFSLLSAADDSSNVYIDVEESFSGGSFGAPSGKIAITSRNGSISIGSAIALDSITLDAAGSISTGSLLSQGSYIRLLARGGSIGVGGGITSFANVDVPRVWDLRTGNNLVHSIGLGAHGNVSVNGQITSPNGSVVVRAGADIVGDSAEPGSSPGSISVSTIDLRDNDGTTGLIYLDARNGDLQTDGLYGNGGAIHLQAGGDLIVNGEISNTAKAAAVRDPFGTFPRPNWVQITSAGTVSINGSIANEGGDFIVNSYGPVYLNASDVAVGDAFGNGSTVVVMSATGVSLVGGFWVSHAATNVENRISILTSGWLQTQGPLLIDASGGVGGAIHIAAKTLDLAGALTLNANSSSQYSGGIAIETGSAVHLAPGSITASATNSLGRGGSIAVSATGGMIVDAGSIDVSAGANGDGGDIYLSTARISNGWFVTSGAGDLAINTALHADGSGTGTGGAITIWGNAINVESSAPEISAASGASGGDGGSVSITAGTNLTLSPTVLRVNARGGNGTGGSIFLKAGDSADGGNLEVLGDLNVNGKGSGRGGTIELIAQTASTDSGGGPIGSFAAASAPVAGSTGNIFVSGNITANGGSTGDGGLVRIEAQNRNSSLPLVSVGGNEPKHITADGGSQSGWGGEVSITSGGSMDFNVDQISARAKGGGSGGTVSIQLNPPAESDDGGGGPIVGASASAVNSTTSGRLSLGNTTINVNGAGEVGDGGAVFVSANSVDLSGTKIVANAGSSGIGGLVDVTANKGLIKFDDGSAIVANGHGEGMGGLVRISYTDEKALLVKGVIAANATGSGNSGDIEFRNLKDTDIKVNIDGTVSADSVEGTVATVSFRPVDDTKGNCIVKILTNGKIEGGIDASGNNVKIDAYGARKTLTILNVTAFQGLVRLTDHDPTSRITVVPSGRINAKDNLTIQTCKLTVNEGATVVSSGNITIAGAIDGENNSVAILGSGRISGLGGPGTRVSISAPNDLTIGKANGSNTLTIENKNSSSTGGRVELSAGHQLTLHEGTTIDTSSASGNGGRIDISAGNGTTDGVIQLLGSVKSNSQSGKGGNIGISIDNKGAEPSVGTRGPEPIVLEGTISASGRVGGTVSFSNRSTAPSSTLSIRMHKGSIRLTGANGLRDMGTINLLAPDHNVSLTREVDRGNSTSELNGKIVANGKDVYILTSGQLVVKSIAASNNVFVKSDLQNILVLKGAAPAITAGNIVTLDAGRTLDIGIKPSGGIGGTNENVVSAKEVDLIGRSAVDAIKLEGSIAASSLIRIRSYNHGGVVQHSGLLNVANGEIDLTLSGNAGGTGTKPLKFDAQKVTVRMNQGTQFSTARLETIHPSETILIAPHVQNLELTTAHAVSLPQAINGQNVQIKTLADDIKIGANINASSKILLSAGQRGAGNVVRTAGILAAPSIVLDARGDVGAFHSEILVRGNPTVQIGTRNFVQNAFVKSQDSLRMDFANAKHEIDLNALTSIESVPNTVISANKLQMTVRAGAIFEVRTDVKSLRFSSTGPAIIHEVGTPLSVLNVRPSTSGVSAIITSTKPLRLSTVVAVAEVDISSTNGITLATGSMLSAASVKLWTTNADPLTKIVLEPGSSILATAVVPSYGIQIYRGTPLQSQSTTHSFPNLAIYSNPLPNPEVPEANRSNVFIENGVTALGPENIISANQLVVSINSAGDSNGIVLGGGVNITAGPRLGEEFRLPPFIDSIPSGADSSFQPIAFVGAASRQACSEYRHSSKDLVLVVKNFSYSCADGRIDLAGYGEAIIDARSKSSIVCGDGTVTLQAGTLCTITRTQESFTVRNLSDTSRHSVAVNMAGRVWYLNAGQEVVLSRDMRTLPGTRASKHSWLDDGRAVQISEFALWRAISDGIVRRELYRSSNRCMLQRVLKTHAALQCIHANRGPFYAR